MNYELDMFSWRNLNCCGVDISHRTAAAAVAGSTTTGSPRRHKALSRVNSDCVERPPPSSIGDPCFPPLKKDFSSPLSASSSTHHHPQTVSDHPPHIPVNNNNNNKLTIIHENMSPLAMIITPTEVVETVVKVISACIPSSIDITVQWQWTNSNTIHSLPGLSINNGWNKLSNIHSGKQIIDFQEAGLTDDMHKLLLPSPSPMDRRFGVILPVLDDPNNTFQCLIAFRCESLSSEELICLDLLETNIRGVFRRLHRLRLNDNAASPSSIPPQENELLQLCSELHDQDPGILQVKVIRYMKKKTQAENAFLLMLSPAVSELFCQVVDDRILTEEIRMAAHENPFAQIFLSRRPHFLKDFDQNRMTELHTFLKEEAGLGVICPLRNILAIPLMSRNRYEPFAVAVLMNKALPETDFHEVDIANVMECFQYTISVLTSSVACQTERRLKNQTQKMFEVAMNIFRKLDDLTVLLREIMAEARKLTNAERCSVFLVEEETQELVAKVFDGLSEKEHPPEIRMPISQGVAGYVATNGEMLNIRDAYSHPLFYRAMDESTGFRTRNILCFPIKDETEKVIGVAQLCNKINGAFFTSHDEDIAKTFAVYCCISIVHSLMYKKVQDAQHRSKLANELMNYHMQVSEDRVHWLSVVEIPPVNIFMENFNQFQSIPRMVQDNDTVLAVVSMFESMGFIRQWRISRNTLARFTLMVKRGYRDPPYHNWYHAFSVAHFAYLCVENLALNEQLSQLEVMALFVASLCHDIDHRGTNNSFQMASQSVLAALYSSEGSVLERHHVSQTMCILNSDGCNIFENLSQKDYCEVLDLIRDIILATDLAHHLSIMKDIHSMADKGYDKQDPRNHYLLLCILMTSADLSDQSKGWKNTRMVAELIYQEFFRQGDLEKALGQKPAEQMDRERACVPDLQVSFLDGIAEPCFKLLAKLYPSCEIMVDNIRGNREKWLKMSQLVREGRLNSSSDSIFHSDLVDFDDVDRK